MVVPLYDARVRDLRPGEMVVIQCVCGHVGLVPTWLVQKKRPEDERILDLGDKCRCRRCCHRGRVMVDAKQALGLR